MRKSKVIPLEVAGKKEVTVKEVSPYAMYKALLAEDKIGEIFALAENCIDLSREELQGLYPSEIEQLTDAFMEVNSSFLAVADKLGLKDTLMLTANKALSTLPAIADGVLTNCPPLFASLFKEAMEKLPGTTAGAVSSPPLKP